MRVLALLLVLGACDCDGEERRSASAPVPAVPEATGPVGSPSADPEQVTFTTEDGITLAGTLRRGGAADAPAVVLVHRLGADRSEWDPLVRALSEPPGLTTLAFDVRGHGGSTAGPEGSTLAYGGFDQSAWEAAAGDVRAALAFLEARDDLSPRAIGLVGSSIGATSTLRAAAGNEQVDAVVAISPGRAYRGVDGITPASELGDIELLAVAAEHELSAVEAAQDIGRIAAEGEVQLYPGSAHGMEIATESPEMLGRVAGFLRQHLEAEIGR